MIGKKRLVEPEPCWLFRNPITQKLMLISRITGRIVSYGDDPEIERLVPLYVVADEE